MELSLLPPPPAAMLQEAENAEADYLQELFERVMTIKEFRVLMLPLLWNARAHWTGSQSSLIMNRFDEWDISRQEQKMAELALILRPGNHRFRQASILKNQITKMIENPQNHRDKSNFIRSVLYKNKMGMKAKQILKDKVAAKLAFKNGKIPATRHAKAWSLVRMWEPETWKPFWECVEILRLKPGTIMEYGGEQIDPNKDYRIMCRPNHLRYNYNQ